MNDQEEDPDVYYISKNEAICALAIWIYEFINLSYPDATHVFAGRDMGGPHCNKEVLAMLKKPGTENKQTRKPSMERA